MAKEVRYVLLHRQESDQAILQFALERGLVTTRRAIDSARIGLIDTPQGVVATIDWTEPGAGAPQSRRLEEVELLAAVLVWCRRSRIPLPRRAAKGIEVMGDSLALTMTLNAARTEAVVSNGQIRYSDPSLDAVPAPGGAAASRGSDGSSRHSAA